MRVSTVYVYDHRWQHFNNDGSNSVDLSGDKPGCIYQVSAEKPQGDVNQLSHMS